MKILLIGYGKMGQQIEQLAKKRGHEIAGVVDVDSAKQIVAYDSTLVDVAIEFTQPKVAYENITNCIKQGIPVISGTTGWTSEYDKVVSLCQEQDGTFLFASNFSLGVNLFFRLNKWLAKLMNQHPYEVSMEETHHIHKKDAPSGTAITLAEGVISEKEGIEDWTLEEDSASRIQIKAIREGEVPGTHIIKYSSEVDQIEIKHEAFSRQGFVLGAVLVAEWIHNKKGVYTMDDFLGNG